MVRGTVILALVMTALPLWAGCNHDAASPCGGAAAATYPERNDDCVTIAEGVWGDVWFWDGAFAGVCPDGTITPAVREIRIHQLAAAGDVSAGPAPSFYAGVATPLVTTVRSDRFGFFQAALPPGRYSVFAVEDTLLYANDSDPAGNLCPVEVVAGRVTPMRLDITYRARF